MEKVKGRITGARLKKLAQQATIINSLYVHGPSSNHEISEITGVSLPTSLKRVNELIGKQILDEKGYGSSSGGRRPVLIGLRDNSLHAIGIHISRHNTRIAIYDNNNNNISGTTVFPSDIVQGDVLADQLQSAVHEIISRTGIAPDRLTGAGVIMPGLVDSRNGINKTHLSFRNGSTQEVLEEKLNVPVFIENDAKAMAHAELRFGKARLRRNVLVIYQEWGLGMGIIIDGRLYRGSLGFAGELSHIPAIDNHIYCQCGKQGCLETITSGSAISRMARESIASGQSSILAGISPNPGIIEVSSVVDAARKGDHCSIRILSETGINLGRSLSSLIQLFNPEMIIITGEIAQAGQYITTPVKQALMTYCMPQLLENTEVVLSELGPDQGVSGAVSMAIEEFLQIPLKGNGKINPAWLNILS